MRRNFVENKRNSNNKSFNTISGEFWTSTSLHGLPRVFTADNILLKAVWALVFCIAFALLCWNTTQLLTKYFGYPAKGFKSGLFLKDFILFSVLVLQYYKIL